MRQKAQGERGGAGKDKSHHTSYLYERGDKLSAVKVLQSWLVLMVQAELEQHT